VGLCPDNRVVAMQTKARCWLFLSYMISFAAVAGAGAVFVSAIQHHSHVQLGVVRDWPVLHILSLLVQMNAFVCLAGHVLRVYVPCLQGCLLQSGFILASALVLWAFRSGDSTDYMIY
jgi:hypothetical protein